MEDAKKPQGATTVVPLPESDQRKKEQVAGMFDRIAGKYDFLNHFLSLGIDKTWRRKAVDTLKGIAPRTILDVATGTGDFAVAALKLNPEKITGIDISRGMLEIGKAKVKKLGLEDKIELLRGDSEALPFPAASFDAVTCAYGVRNFEDLAAGLKEMCRVLKPGGKVTILEFSKPSSFPVKQFYGFYFRYILPGLGKLVSRDKTAYTYLPESVAAFPEGSAFCAILEECGYHKAHARPLAFGITTLYTAEKPANTGG